MLTGWARAQGEKMNNHPLDNKDYMILKMLHDGSPSIPELKDAILVRSTGTVAYRLKQMEDLGLVTQPSKNRSRSRSVTQRGKTLLQEAGLVK